MSHSVIDGILPNFNKLSFMAGAVMAYSEAVGYGVKQLGLSSLYSLEELDVMLKVIEYGSERYGTAIRVEPDLIKTKLFARDIAAGKTVVLIANNQSVLDEYDTLKREAAESSASGHPEDIEVNIARRFGRLLSYDEASIEALIAKNG